MLPEIFHSDIMEQPAIIVQRYVDILSDAGFKAVFGDHRNKDVLIDLINVLLPESRSVKDISYATTEIPGFSLSNKSVRLDLRCTGDEGSEFIVEMQCYRQENLFRRCVLYSSLVYSSGSRKGDRQEYELPPVYFICLLSGDAEISGRTGQEWEEHVVTEYTFREKAMGDVPDETISCIFVELNRFRKPLEDCGTLVDKWCYALKHIGTLDRLPEDLRVEALERLFRACEISKFDKAQKLSYEKNMITERDYYNIINTAKKDGIRAGLQQGLEEGLQQGLEEGRQEGKVEVAGAMKRMGIPMETIMQATGLSREEIERI